MARRTRLHVPGGLYHVILRGNGGEGVFFEDEDRHRRYLLLKEEVERFGHRIHGFRLMSNHLHLVQPGDVPLSRIMQNVGFRYTCSEIEDKAWFSWDQNRGLSPISMLLPPIAYSFDRPIASRRTLGVL